MPQQLRLHLGRKPGLLDILVVLRTQNLMNIGYVRVLACAVITQLPILS